MKKKKIWKKLIFFFIVFSLFSSSFIIYTTKPKYRFENNYGENSFIKTSDNEISIITPENKTYAKPMSGYYPATYGFENDENGVIPEEWSFFTSYTGFAQVVEEMDGHNKVVELKDAGGGGGATIVSNTFSSQITGIIECYIYLDYPHNSGDYLMIQIHDQAPIDTIVIYWENGNLIVYDGTTPTTVGSYDAYTWYHVRIQFDCADDWHLWIDENSVDGGSGYEFRRTTTTSITKFDMRTWSDNVFNYLDAVCYSWDPNYNIGTNLDQGLLLNFDNYPSLDWMGYSLDGLANKTILGNTTLPLPTNGAHNIQVFGNNSLGTMYASNLRYFTINITNYIEILTPENKTYSAPMSGYYPATYGFENDDDGSDPEGWSLNENPPNYEIEVVSEKQGHKKVVHFYDNENAWRSMNHYPDGNPTTGTIELWVLGFDVTDYRFDIGLWDTTIRRGFVVIIADDKWQYWDAGYHDVPNVGIPQDNTWHHLRIDFRCAGAPIYEGLSMASYKIIVDGIESGEIPFWEAANHLERLSIGTDAAPNSEWWVDAVSFSWDPNYNIGDNLNKGLLLSFDNYPRLGWIGYSLDGLANKTISGNTTLSLPANGSHNIQVFGNDSLGTIYASNLRHFTLDLPMISITTPENKTYKEPMSGYYPATYGFENDELNTLAQEWTTIISQGTDAFVTQSFINHYSVFQIYDTTASHSITIYNYFTGQNFGTIEMWCAVDDVYQPSSLAFNIRDGSNTYGPEIRLRYGKFTYNDGDSHDIVSASSNQWYHIRVDFRCTGASTYEGLNENHYFVYINGIKYGEFPFINNIINATLLAIGVGHIAKNSAYIDAVGYSWDPNYGIGNNFNEGLLLSFENRTALDWIGYSLDGQTNKTILGTATIPFLGDGTHFIQVFGNDTLGTKYQSEIRYFSINAPPPSINIITPSSDDFYSIIAPSFSISITAFNQIISWYTLDDGGTNITFTGSSGTINQTEWDEEGEGPITIRFYANDSFGRLNYAEITINKDITDPVIIINSPLFGDQFTTIPPRFNISVDELNIDAMWYTIDGGLTNYGIAEYSGYIDSTAWNSAPNGAVTIRFYVRDKAGNIDYEDVVVQKNVQPYIPPDNNFIIIISVAIGALLIFVGVILILYIILSRKRKYEPYKFKEPRKPEIRVKPKYGYLICPYCHNENLVKNNYCIYCGASLIEFKPDNM